MEIAFPVTVPYVVNVSGWGNFGADCYLDTLRESLGEVWPDCGVVVKRVDPTPFLPESQSAVVFGGGGILYQYLHNGTIENLRHFLRYAAVMQMFGKPAFALCLGVQGPLEKKNLEPYLEILQAMELRTVRDARSAEILRAAGVSAPIIESADLSYLIRIPRRPGREAKTKPTLGVAVSQPLKGIIHPEYAGLEDRVIEALDCLQSQFDIRFYEFDRRHDGAIPGGWKGRREHSAYDPAAAGAVAGFLESVAESDLFLTSRLHGVTLCARMGVPFVSMGAPGEKVDREAQALEHSFHLSYSTSAEDIVKAVRNAWDGRAEIQKRIEVAAVRREKMARRTVEALHACKRQGRKPVFHC